MALLPPFTRIITRRPAHTLAKGLTTRDYLGEPNIDLAMQQYDGYLAAIQSLVEDVTTLPANDDHPDAHYVEDVAVIFRDMAFITHPGADERAAESATMAAQLSHLNRVYTEGDEARIEGGDVLFCEDRVLIGLSTRTNKAGAEQLAVALRTVQPDLKVDLIPIEGVLHLKTGMTEIAPNVLVLDPHMRYEGDLSFADIITLPEAEGYAANVIPINGSLLMSKGDYPTVQQIAEKYYDNIVAVDMTEFEKMDGSLTCLSLRY